MGKRIENLRRKALELSSRRDELEDQKKVNIDDLSVIESLLCIPLEDASSVQQIELLSEIMDNERDMIDKEFNKNNDIILDTLEEIDDCIGNHENIIQKIKSMSEITGLVDVKPQIEEVKASIDELDEIRSLLDADSLRQIYGHDAITQAIEGSENSIGFDVNEYLDGFTQKISKQKGLSGKYLNEIINKFNTGNPDAQRAFIKYIPPQSVADYKYQKTDHYSVNDRVIRMNFEQDLFNTCGVGTNYFHEHGHMIDMIKGDTISDDEAFRDALESDFISYILNYMSNNNVTVIETYLQISESDDFWSDSHSAVSDLFGAMSNGQAQGKWGHDRAYWERDSTQLTKEAFAHFYEAQFDKERLRIITSYFPNAAKEFNRLLGGI